MRRLRKNERPSSCSSFVPPCTAPQDDSFGRRRRGVRVDRVNQHHVPHPETHFHYRQKHLHSVRLLPDTRLISTTWQNPPRGAPPVRPSLTRRFSRHAPRRPGQRRHSYSQLLLKLKQTCIVRYLTSSIKPQKHNNHPHKPAGNTRTTTKPRCTNGRINVHHKDFLSRSI